MKKSLVVLLALVSVFALPLAGFSAEEKEGIKYGPNVGDNFKPFTLTDPVKHKQVPFASALEKGKDTILFFMNTTCSLCLSEEKMFAESWDAMKGKVNIYLVSVDFDGLRIESYVKSQGIPFPILHDPEGQVLGNVGFTGTPALVVVDNEGKIKQKISGYDQNAVRGYIKKLTR